ncbi:MAG: hypothetical protein LHV69_00275 [Elusimicrobia bacterium]|nr:hypothetical protein [Candidatus Obscuribacterium magneticum]MCB4755466.1 hypothetical protein [Candidatus Obscuribacterium magneticum]
MFIRAEKGKGKTTIYYDENRTKVIDTERGKKGSLEKYLLEGEGWVGKLEVIQLVRAERVINAVAVRANGSTYVRSKPDKTTANNFSEMADD